MQYSNIHQNLHSQMGYPSPVQPRQKQQYFSTTQQQPQPQQYHYQQQQLHYSRRRVPILHTPPRRSMPSLPSAHVAVAQQHYYQQQQRDDAHSPMASSGESNRPLRPRLGTEETEVIRNGGRSQPQEPQNHFSPIRAQPQQPQNDDDDCSVVSSLSNDEDSLIVAQRNALLPPIVEDAQQQSTPPMEVSIPLQKPTPKPALARPTLGRYRSCPQMGYKAVPAGALVINGQVVQGLHPRHPDPFSNDYATPAMLTGRKRRQQTHYRTQSGTSISVGSMVGQSSLLTAPTMSSSSDTESASSLRRNMQQMQLAQRKLSYATGADEGRNCCNTPSRKMGSVVRNEVKHLLGKVSTPIRKLHKRGGGVSLKRASGTLA